MTKERTLVKHKENVLKTSLFILLCALMFVLGKCSSKKQDVSQDIVVQKDTIVKVDTVEYYRTEFKDRYIYDTIEIESEKEKIVYIKDTPHNYIDSTEKYRIEINATKLYDYNLTLFNNDSCFYTKEVAEIPKKKWYEDRFYWTFGFGVHYGLVYRNVDVGPYVGFGIKF